MQILEQILETLPDGETLDVQIGLHWTAVVVNTAGVRRCGLASTLRGEHAHGHEADVPDAGKLLMFSACELAGLALSPRPTQASIGIAAINALLPRRTASWLEENAEMILARRGKNRRVVMVGHFPFVGRLKDQVGQLQVLEQEPGPGDLPAEMAAQVLPLAEVVAITGMTFANGTLEGLLQLCSPEAFVMVLGPSAPLSPVLFEHGVDLISGSVVTAIDPVLRILSQGGNFRQLHPAGVRLVNMIRAGAGVER